MMKRIVDAGGIFDWITPLCSLLSSDAQFNVHEADQGWIEIELQRQGIHVKRGFFHGGTYCFDVDHAAADEVRRIIGA